MIRWRESIIRRKGSEVWWKGVYDTMEGVYDTMEREPESDSGYGTTGGKTIKGGHYASSC